MNITKNGAFWTSLITVLVTLGVLTLDDGQITDLGANIEMLIKYAGLIIAAIAGALGIRAKE